MPSPNAPIRESALCKTSAQTAIPARHVTAVLGPTNTGKTHLAIERMLAHETGMIGLPLRLLAREVYDKLCKRANPEHVALITGEEKIKPENPRYYVCTVEAMPRDLIVDLVAIDEVQLAADPERGHIFTDRLIHMRGTHETLLLGAGAMKNAILDIVPNANTISRPRLSRLSYSGQKKISRLPPRTAIVTFSANEVYSIAELIRRQRGGAAVVMGALSPRTRNAQVELYQSGDVDFIIATDAIGMGLNLDVDHVAFAGTRKFDGQQHRTLSAAELAQIAGRAGRHLNDGSFGVTGSVEPFEQQLVDQLEGHQFAPVKMLQWRNRNLDFSSLQSLMDSLSLAPSEPRLTGCRASDDLLALETLDKDPEIRQLAQGEEAVVRLWDACQLPDYRNVSPQQHADIIGSVYKFIMGANNFVPEDWFEEQVRHADSLEGDIDSLANRIAHIRTWTFISSRPDWLAEPEKWQQRTHAIEDRLSDALHEKLTKRFVDRRTSTLMRRLRDEEELYADIDNKGNIHVEKHFVGHLQGFRYTPDNNAEGLQGKAARAAAAQILSGELTERAQKLAESANSAFKLSRTGNIMFQDELIGRLERSDNLLTPKPKLFSDEHLQPADKQRVIERLEKWLSELFGELLQPLIALQTAEDVTGLSRGLAFQLVENYGSLKRSLVAEELRQLDQPARKQLRKYGVRFGAFNIFIPALLKPAPSELMLLLWALNNEGGDGAIDIYDLPEPPRAGLTSEKADRALPEPFYRTAGFQPCGPRVVRMDMLERLDQQIRPLIIWRKNKSEQPRPKGAYGNGGFLVQPEMLSILGCSWEEMNEILPALNFQVERRRIEIRRDSPEAKKCARAALESLAAFVSIPELPAENENAEKEVEQFEEIWRPRRARQHGPRHHHKGGGEQTRERRHTRSGNGNERKAKDGEAKDGEGRHKGRKDGAQNRRGGGRNNDQKRNARPPRHNNTDGQQRPRSQNNRPRTAKAVDPDSPFAALGDLKKQLEKNKRGKK